MSMPMPPSQTNELLGVSPALPRTVPETTFHHQPKRNLQHQPCMQEHKSQRKESASASSEPPQLQLQPSPSETPASLSSLAAPSNPPTQPCLALPCPALPFPLRTNYYIPRPFPIYMVMIVAQRNPNFQTSRTSLRQAHDGFTKEIIFVVRGEGEIVV